MKALLAVAAVLLVVVLVIIGVRSEEETPSSNNTQEVVENENTNTNTSPASETTLRVNDLNPGGREVSIEQVQMSVSGFVIIREDNSGTPGAVIGVSDNIGPGLMTEVIIELERETVNNDILYAQLYRDNGDSEFNEQDDAPVKNSDGSVISETFFADVATTPELE
ncbi:MAG: hypothetical protein WDZ88_00680 [Candidatus Paceibacterota bacterium]